MVVIDASVAAKWCLLEEGRGRARALFLGGEPIIAPQIVMAEVLNALWKNVRRSHFAADQMGPTVDALVKAFTRLEEVAPLAKGAAELSLALDHPVYDCFYLALAEREQCPLITADDRLYRKTRRTRFSQIVRKLA